MTAIGDEVAFESTAGGVRQGYVAAVTTDMVRVMDVLEPLATGQGWTWSEWVAWPSRSRALQRTQSSIEGDQ